MTIPTIAIPAASKPPREVIGTARAPSPPSEPLGEGAPLEPDVPDDKGVLVELEPLGEVAVEDPDVTVEEPVGKDWETELELLSLVDAEPEAVPDPDPDEPEKRGFVSTQGLGKDLDGSTYLRRKLEIAMPEPLAALRQCSCWSNTW